MAAQCLIQAVRNLSLAVAVGDRPGGNMSAGAVSAREMPTQASEISDEASALLWPRARWGQPPPWPYPKGVWDSVLSTFAFTEWPPRDQWETVFAATLSEAASEPCEAPILGNARLSPYGLGSRLNTFADEVMVAMYSRKPLALCSPEGLRDDWSRFFEDPGFARCRASTCTFVDFQGTDTPLLAWIMGRFVSEAAEEPGVEAVKRFLYPRLFRLKTDTRLAVEDLQIRLNLRVAPYVGVHIRRGDKKSEVKKMVTTDAYASQVLKCASQVGASTVFLASDSAEVLAELQAALGTQLEVVEQPRLPEELYSMRGADASNEPGAVAARQVILDAALLAGAAAFVGTASSNIGRLVYFLRDPSAGPAVSMDDADDFLWRGAL